MVQRECLERMSDASKLEGEELSDWLGGNEGERNGRDGEKGGCCVCVYVSTHHSRYLILT